jgi:CheY-like chemotaxis protein
MAAYAPDRGLEARETATTVRRVPPSSPPTILICEDEVALRELIRAALGVGYRYAEAGDGREALELVEAVHPDVVILDVMMPGPSGLDVLAALQEGNGGDIPVVVLTAWSHEREAALARGAARFLSKPFDPDELKTIVDELVADR